jgi:hypothetical protein
MRLALPLRVRELQCTDHRRMGYIIDANGLELAYGDMALSMHENAAIAADIVRAVNAHGQLVEALCDLVEQVERGDFDHIATSHPDSKVIAARAALAAACGEVQS